MNVRGLISASVVGAALLAAGASGAVLLLTEQVPVDLQAAKSPTAVPTSRQEFTDERTVQATLVVSDPLTLRLRVGGTVTASGCTPGRPIASGSVVARIDDRPVVALQSTVPIYRDLAKGLKGDDVLAVQKELSRLGYRTPTAGTYDAATATAVKRFRKDHGEAKPDGTLALDHLVWLPARAVRPSKCGLALGAVVTPGGELAEVSGQLTAVRLKSAPDDLVPGARVIRVFGASGPLDANRSATSVPFLAAVAATPEYQAQAATPSPDPTPVTIALAKPLSTVKVPPAAVFGLQGTHGCVQSGPRSVPVEVVGSGLGASLVTVTGQPPATVNLGVAITATGCR